MSPPGARRASLPLQVAVLIILTGIIPTAPRLVVAGERLATLNETDLLQLTSVVVEQQEEELTVHLETGRIPRYRVTSLVAPTRIVIHLEGTRDAWRRPLTATPEPIRGIRGSQWKPDTARVVVELSRPVGYSIEERRDGVVLRLDRGAGNRIAQVVQPQPSAVSDGTAAGGVATKGSSSFKVIPTPISMKGQVEVGYRGFLSHRGQGLVDNNVDLMGELDSTFEFGPGLHLRLHPRVALDPLEQARNRFAPYDAYVEYTAETWALLAGQVIENWSAVNMFSPADLLNRRDIERNTYNPEKLGELIVRLRLFLPERDWIRQPTLSLYALPLLQDTPLPTNHDRFRLDITGDNVGDVSKHTVHPSFDKGFAARSTATVGSADLALFYYGGLGRLPSFALDPTSQAPRLTPVYYRVDAVSATVQWTLGPWVLKGEAVYSVTNASGLSGVFKAAVPDSYFQYVAGGERTFTDVLGKNEVTVWLEYSGETNPRVTSLTGLRPFKSDLFIGANWQFHDQRRTEIRAFVATNVLESAQLWLVSFNTILYGNLKLLLEGQFVNRGASKPPDHLSVFAFFPNNANMRIALRYEF
jgi:hypothetical protein